MFDAHKVHKECHKAHNGLKIILCDLCGKKHNPNTAIRTSLADYRKEAWFTNVPLYAIGNYFCRL